jgi:hypothetical protein
MTTRLQTVLEALVKTGRAKEKPERKNPAKGELAPTEFPRMPTMPAKGREHSTKSES